ncbi:hypothetical protein C8J35_101747 [Rhizobium sp. PP-F2F-G38]|uniref:Uncharacterized protein n=2 Tax=Hyphomicrobiales TaxID=356 RepID=A0AA44CB74_9HYPH|nr:hypothetical protein [Ferranicluibacter rubi]PYE37473.1 hypothetical protein C8J37_101748 [Rhizobium sp. PP-WC-1G-195]PYF00925.1 hypothetical protein C8J35_101747 [Rhizobium sp. PP-F2F-G38]TCP90391.1 hypothetical protein C8J31_101229 [Rhizobium sp. PP-CC-2G-626]TCQ27753.1 hypothetical protein C8J33_101380 [Rhizobium sp. PP-CC-3G-465]NHT76489.1 hypothetical protein [Ferranicluibacter rubi]
MSMQKPATAVAEPNVVTAQEALEPLFVKLEVEADARLIRAAVSAGWTAEEAVAAIDDLRRQDMEPSRH